MGTYEDLMNQGLFGGVATGFVQGLERGSERRMREVEMNAKITSQAEDKKRQTMMDALALRTANVKYDANSGQFSDMPMTQHQKSAADLSGMEKGIKTTWGENDVPSYSYDPNSPQMIGAKTKQYGMEHKGDVSPKDWAKLSDALDPNKARGGQLAKVQGVINSSDRIHGIFNQFPDGNIPKAQATELATAVAGLISGGSPQSQHQIDSIVPQSMAGNAQDMVSWFTGDPQGRDQQKFIKILRETSERERVIAQQQKWDAQSARLPQFEYLSEHPQYQKILKAYGVSTDRPSDYQAPVESAPPQGMVKPGLLDKFKGMIGFGSEANAAPPASAGQDPQISQYAAAHGMGYDEAAALIAQRKAKMGVK